MYGTARINYGNIHLVTVGFVIPGEIRMNLFVRVNCFVSKQAECHLVRFIVTYVVFNWDKSVIQCNAGKHDAGICCHSRYTTAELHKQEQNYCRAVQ